MRVLPLLILMTVPIVAAPVDAAAVPTPSGWTSRIKSTHPALDGQQGEFTSVRPSPRRAEEPDPRLPRWWTDDPTPEWSEAGHMGAGTVSQWRAAFLRDFARRLDRCRGPAGAQAPSSDRRRSVR
jgi:hypothetical protein